MDGALRHRHGRCCPLPPLDPSEEGLIVIGAVNHDVGVHAPLGAKGQMAGCGRDLHGRCEQGEVVEPPPVDRQFVERLAGHYVAAGWQDRVKHRCRHLDPLVSTLNVHPQCDAYGAADTHNDAVSRGRSEVGTGGSDFVAARAEGAELDSPHAVAPHRPLRSRLDVGRDDFGIDDHTAIPVFHTADDAAEIRIELGPQGHAGRG